jgi:putative tricarboxylic transport membrane protein
MGRQQMAGLIFLSIGIYGLVFSIPLPWGTWEEPGPGLFPLTVAILLCLAGVMKIVQNKGNEEGGGTDWREIARGFLTPMKILGVTLLFILILERLGYLLAAPLFLFILLWWVCRYRIRVALVLALVIGVGSWYFFGKILEVNLPQGILRFL